MTKNKSVNGSKRILKELDKLMEALGQKVEIDIGILGEQAYEKHPHSDLTMSHLGAIHEFGATIPVTDKMRNYLHYQGIHLKSNTTEVKIPARSFLRDTFFNSEAKERLMDTAMLGESSELNREYFEYKQTLDPNFFMAICQAIGAKGLQMVQDSFRAGGYPTKWQPITEYTKQHRIGDASQPPLSDTGDLRDSIRSRVRKV